MPASLPSRLVDRPGSGGTLARRTSDFWVDETLPYAPDGDGSHLFLRVVKVGLTTPQTAQRLAERLGVPPREVGVAGLKDRVATTRQWLSVPWPLSASLPDVERLPADVAAALDGGPLPRVEVAEGVFVTDVARHRHKLRRGHVRSNAFRVRIREVSEGGLDRARDCARALQTIGLPNRFGAQRFGRRGDNADRARRFLVGEQTPPRDRRQRALLLSALQAEIFNAVLERRWESGLWDRVVPGDVMVRHDPPAMFEVTDPSAEQARLDRFEIAPTGPLFGKKMRAASGSAGELEQRVLEEARLSSEVVARLGPGSRRALRLPLPADLNSSEPEPGTLELAFTLPAGAYATVLLDELCDLAALRPDDQGSEMRR